MKESYALVLEGGGMRGAYTAGALAWLGDHHIQFDYSVGISSGALYLISFLTGNQQLPYNLSTRYITDPTCVGPLAFFQEGHFVAYQKIFRDYLIAKEGLSVKPLKALNPNMEIGVYDMEKGETVFFGPQDIDDDMQLLLASCALPIASARVYYQGRLYMDGGISKMIPIERSVEKGNTRHLIIMTKPADYVRKPAGILPRLGMKLFYGEYPKENEDYRDRHINYNRQMAIIRDLEADGQAMLIRPSRTIKVGRFSGSQADLQALYDLGYADMEARQEELAVFMERTDV